MQIKSGQRGVTLVELTIVLVLSALLAALGAPLVANVLETANTLESEAEQGESLDRALRTMMREIQEADSVSCRDGGIEVDGALFNVDSGQVVRNGDPLTPPNPLQGEGEELDFQCSESDLEEGLEPPLYRVSLDANQQWSITAWPRNRNGEGS